MHVNHFATEISPDLPLVCVFILLHQHVGVVSKVGKNGKMDERLHKYPLYPPLTLLFLFLSQFLSIQLLLKLMKFSQRISCTPKIYKCWHLDSSFAHKFSNLIAYRCFKVDKCSFQLLYMQLLFLSFTIWWLVNFHLWLSSVVLL